MTSCYICFSSQFIKSQTIWGTEGDEITDLLIGKIWRGRESSTVNNYCLRIKKFLAYAKNENLCNNLPWSSISVARYLTHLHSIGIPKSTITSSLAAFKWVHSFIPGLNKWNDPLSDEFLSKISSAICRESSVPKNQKSPLTGEIISEIVKGSNLDDLVQLRDCLMICCAYSLLLRYDEISHINCNHIERVSLGYRILIPKSKTDKFRDGKFVFLSHSVHQFSSANLLSKYLLNAGLEVGKNHFLFGPLKKSSNGFSVANSILSYASFNDIVKKAVGKLGLDKDKFGTHSCRSGGATDLAPNVTEHELLVSGRWADPRSIRSYVEMTDESRFHMNNILQSRIGSSDLTLTEERESTKSSTIPFVVSKFR